MVISRRIADLDHAPRADAVSTMGAGGRSTSRVEQRGEAGADRGPLGVEDREVDRVALVAPYVHVFAERALAHRAEPRDRLLRADVAAVGLERHAHAAERLEAVPQEEQLRLSVGGCAPAVAAPERRADLDLPVSGTHVE